MAQNNIHAVVRTDNMAGTDVRAQLASLMFHASEDPADIDNGNVVVLDKLLEGEREVYKAVAPTVKTPLNEVYLVASVEMDYDPRNKGLETFYNKAGAVARGYAMHHGATFSVTKEALDGKAEPEVGSVVELKAGTKLNIPESTATPGSTVVGKIIAIEQAGMHKYYVCKIN